MSVPVTSPCSSCGYDVAGLDLQAVCPECATPVWTSRAEFLGRLPMGHAVRVGRGIELFRHGLRVLFRSAVTAVAAFVILVILLLVDLRLLKSVLLAFMILPIALSIGFAMMAVGLGMSLRAMETGRVSKPFWSRTLVVATWSCGAVCLLTPLLAPLSLWRSLPNFIFLGVNLRTFLSICMSCSFMIFFAPVQHWLVAIALPTGPQPSRLQIESKLADAPVVFLVALVLSLVSIFDQRAMLFANVILLMGTYYFLQLLRLTTEVADRYSDSTMLVRGVIRGK